jgi:hypothetical protein
MAIAGKGKAVPETRGDRGDSYPGQGRARQGGYIFRPWLDVAGVAQTAIS